MQVNTISDHVTHAVLTTKVAREAQISNSAEFFNVLSNTLYSDKKLAVIREVLCNAWDIHIQCGITDKPVEVTLTNDKLTIRDFGTGIHDDHIVDVYLTYGNSTKKLDGTQTGGFGLGSKAPWAYVDHFEVISFHDKRKTIYNLSKSSGEVGGKPSAIPIMTVPTEESGLQVSMAVDSRSDAEAFHSIIETIAQFGEMNVMFNGQPIKTIAFSQAKHGFLFIKAPEMKRVSGSSNTRIFLRYGNVVYPLPYHEKIAEVSHIVSKIIDRISGHDHYGVRNNQYNLILQAKPDTISVTPSRESLSMTDHTIKHVDILLQEFADLYNSQLTNEVITTTREGIANTWSRGRPADLLTSNNRIPGLFTFDEYGTVIERKTPTIITDVKTASVAYLSKSYPDLQGFQAKDVLMRLKALEVSGFGDRGKIRSYRKEYERVVKNPTLNTRRNNWDGGRVSDWFQRVMVQPLVRKLNQVDGLSGDKLLVRGRHVAPTTERRSWRQEQSTAVIEATKLSPRSLDQYMPFLRNFVVLAFNRLDMEERLPHFPIMKHWLGEAKNMFCYIVPRTAGKADIAREFFEAQGMTVVDLTKAQSWEHPTVVLVEPKPIVRKPRKKGLPVLSGILYNGSLKPDRIVTWDEFPRTETPEFIVQMNPRAQSACSYLISALKISEVQLAIELYGDKGAVVVNDNQRKRFSDMGVPYFEDWLIQRIVDEITTNPRLESHFALRMGALPDTLTNKLDYDNRSVLKLIMSQPQLAKQFNMVNNSTPDDRKIFSIYQGFKNYYASSGTERSKIFKAAIDHVEAIKPHPNLEPLVTKLLGSKLTKYLDISQIRHFFEYENVSDINHKPNAKRREGILDLLLYAIEG